MDIDDLFSVFTEESTTPKPIIGLRKEPTTKATTEAVPGTR
jgi:hypothetical protein